VGAGIFKIWTRIEFKHIFLKIYNLETQ
jgi:hypothetical protein